MIQNILTFCVKNDLTYVSGSIPSGKLVANDVNRNSIYLITPYDEAIVKANFQTNLQSDTPTSVLGILVNGEIEVGELVDTNASYYNLVKDWNIYEFKVPSTTLSFISRNRTGKIGINFSIEQRLVPMIKVSYGTYKGEITDLAQTPTEDGYYIIKALGYEYQDSVELKSFDLNDILVYNATTDVATKISAYSNRGSTPTSLYSVDPSLLNDNFETITPSLTAQIVQQVNDNTGDILLLNQGVLNDGVAITDLQKRMSVAESDISIAENNIVNLQGRMATAESDIDKIENGTTIVEKALRDSVGNVIKDHYVASVIPTYDDNTNNLYLNPYNGNDSLMPTRIEGVNLPKATISKDGLMAKEDKVKVDNIAGDISSAITTHDGSVVAHLHLRTLINDLQKEIDRLNAKGRSWGEVDKTFSELWAMAEPTRSEYITDYLLIEFPNFIAEDGSLVYTKNTDTEEEHELEFNLALSQWVDNGAYVISKASNTQHGIVKGDLTYVSILNGIIQVLKSDYATNIGSSGASYDYADLLALFTEVANDIYKKNETYSNAEIEQRLTDLLALANLQDTAIEKSAGVFVFNNGDSILASSLAQYNWVITRFYNVDGGVQNVRYNLFKPSEAVSGNRTIVQIDRTPIRYAEIKRDNGNILFRVVDESDIFDNAYVCTMKMWGIKLDGISADEISYDGTISGLSSTNVKTAIDEVVVDTAVITNVLSKKLSEVLLNVSSEEYFARGYVGADGFTEATDDFTVMTRYLKFDYPVKVFVNDYYFSLLVYNENKTALVARYGAQTEKPTIPANTYFRIAFAKTVGYPYQEVTLDDAKNNIYIVGQPFDNGEVEINSLLLGYYDGETTEIEVSQSSTNEGYIETTTGVIQPSGRYRYTDFLPVNFGNKIIVSEAPPIFMCFYDKFQNLLYGIGNSTGSSNDMAYNEEVVINNKFVAYVRINCRVEVNSQPQVVTINIINKCLTDKIVSSLSVFEGKKYCSFGDSISWYDGNGYTGYQQQVIKVLKLDDTYLNKGVSGASIATTSSGLGYTPIVTTVKATTGLSNYDLISVFGGTNDFKIGSPLGTIGAIGDTNFDETTFYGAYRSIIEYILGQNPNTRLVLITPLQRNNNSYNSWNTENTQGVKLKDYVEAIKKLGEMYSLPVVDLFSDAGFNSLTLSNYTIDGLHPNNKGYIRVGNCIAGNISKCSL